MIWIKQGATKTIAKQVHNTSVLLSNDGPSSSVISAADSHPGSRTQPLEPSVLCDKLSVLSSKLGLPCAAINGIARRY